MIIGDRYLYAIVSESGMVDPFWSLVTQKKETARRSADGRIIIKRLASEPLPPEASMLSILEHEEVLGELRADEAWNLPPDWRIARVHDAIAREHCTDQVTVELL